MPLTREQERIIEGTAVLQEILDHPGFQFFLQILKDHTSREEDLRHLVPQVTAGRTTIAEEYCFRSGRLSMAYDFLEMPRALMREAEALTDQKVSEQPEAQQRSSHHA